MFSKLGTGNPEAYIVVPVRRRVVVPISGTAVCSVVVPTAAANHAVRPLRFSTYIFGAWVLTRD